MSRITNIRVHKNTEVLAEQRYYDDTYLVGDDDGSAVLFVTDAAYISTPMGNEKVRVRTDALEFATVDELIRAIVDGGWREKPSDDPKWKPDRNQLIATLLWSR